MRVLPITVPALARRRRRAALGALPLLLSACGLPTEVPQLDQRWITPAKVSAITVAELLPSGVTIVPDSSAFEITVAGTSALRLLRDDCAACAAANGTVAPKPAFTATLSASASLPGDLVAATILPATLQLILQHNLTFDPLRPSASARGFVVITVTSGSTVIGRDSVDGATTALPPGISLTRSIPLSGTVTGAVPATVTVRISSPAGDPVSMDANRTFFVITAPTTLRAASASVLVGNVLVGTSSTLDLTDVGESVTSHLTGGAIVLDITNPFNVAGNVTVRLSGAGMTTITRTMALVPGSSHHSLPLNADELRSMFGREVTLTANGIVSQTGGPVTISPRQGVTVSSRLDVTVHTGGASL